MGLYQEATRLQLDIIKIETGAIALVLGKEVTTATDQAMTALENNCVKLLAGLAAKLLFKEGVKQAGKAAMKKGAKGAAKKGVKEVGKEEAKQGAKNAASQVKSSPKADTVKGQAVPEPKSVAQAQKYKRNLREKMGKPHAEDQDLRQTLERLHRKEENCVGSGSTAAAARHEIRTGQLVNGKSHLQKARDGIRELQKWVDNNPNARPGDRAAAENMLRDLEDALSTIKGGK